MNCKAIIFCHSTPGPSPELLFCKLHSEVIYSKECLKQIRFLREHTDKSIIHIRSDRVSLLTTLKN